MESYLSHVLSSGLLGSETNAAAPTATPAASTAALVAIMRGLGHAAVAGTKARPGVLGPLVAHCMTAVSEAQQEKEGGVESPTTSQLLGLLNSMAAMKLTPRDTQVALTQTIQRLNGPLANLQRICNARVRTVHLGCVLTCSPAAALIAGL